MSTRITDTLSGKKSIGISFVTQYVELTIHFVGVLVLARLLSPDDIGVYSVAAFLMTVLHVFRDFGVVQYIIQEHELTREKIRSAMGVAILLALAVAIVLYASSGLIARFYGNPTIEKILAVMAASFAISPFGSLLVGIFRRENKLQTIFYVKTISAVCHVLVAVSLASAGFGAISLAWATFAGILSFGIAASLARPKHVPWLPSFRNMKAILAFGGVSSAGNAADIAGTNIPDLVIGKMMGMAAVGYFSRATGLVQLFTRLISSALLPLVLPYFARLRREGKDLAAPYLNAVEQLTALAWPFFAALALLAYPMIRTLYGAQWDASVPIAELLCLAGAIGSISLFATQVMVANGQFRDAMWAQILAQPFRVGAVLLAASYGLMHIAFALIATELVTLLIVSWFLHKTITVAPLDLIRACKKSALVTVCSAVGPLLVKVFWASDPSRPWLPLCIGILGAAVGWIGSMALTRHPLAEQMISVLHMRRFAAQAHIQENSANGHANAMIKVIAYRSGMLGAYHRFRNRGQLTVAMFHRILPVDDSRYSGADPEWTMTPNSFAQCLQFFRRHYNVVSPEQVFAALRGEGHLPRRSLLVTFDDGWVDTAEYAQPILDAYSIPSLVFVVGSAIDRSTPFWEEVVYALLSTHAEGYAQLRLALKPCGVVLPEVPPTQMNEKSIRAIISRLAKSDRRTLESVTGSLDAAYGNNAAMLDCEQLVQLDASIHTIGGHGMSHQPLTSVTDIHNEMISAQAAISGYLNKPKIESMSFPHGAYSDSVIAHCRSVGYKYLFSSDAHLNTLDDKNGTYSPVGRIHISERWITNNEGEFQPALLATWLFLRPTVHLH